MLSLIANLENIKNSIKRVEPTRRIGSYFYQVLLGTAIKSALGNHQPALVKIKHNCLTTHNCIIKWKTWSNCYGLLRQI